MSTDLNDSTAASGIEDHGPANEGEVHHQTKRMERRIRDVTHLREATSLLDNIRGMLLTVTSSSPLKELVMVTTFKEDVAKEV